MSARASPAMTAPAMAPGFTCVLLLLGEEVLPSVLAVDSTEAETVAFKSPVPALPARSLYVPARGMMHAHIKSDSCA